MHELVEDDVTVDGGACGSKGASPKRLKFNKVEPGCSRGDAKSQSRKRQKIVLKTNGVKLPDIRMFWKGKGEELPGDFKLSLSNKTV